MVKASYSTGKPALGVGAGNASVLVDDTADLKMAASSIVMGKTFDNGVICASEQSTVVIESIFEEFKALLQKRGVHFVYGEERKKLGEFLIKGGSINPDIVGQSAQTIAQKCGIKIPGDAVVIATEASEVGPHEPFSFEKLSPVMTLYRAASFNEAKDLCASIVHFGGEGHTAVIHSNDENRIAAFAAAMPAHHLFANVPSSIAAVGTAFNFNVPPSLTLGVGTTGGSSIATNLTPASLINVKLMASRQEHMEWMKTPPNLYFNRNCTREAIADLAKPYPGGKRDTRAMIITDRAMVEFGYCTKVQMMLEQIGFKVAVFDEVAPDPTIECVRAGAAACEQFKPEVLIGLGGGSPMDAAKGIRVFYEHPEAKLEDVGARFIELRKRTCPFPDTGSKVHKLVCIPTTSGTGSEVTPFAVITEGTHKYPLFSYRMTPDVAIVDSAFCDNLPKSLVANAGVDALVHAIEAYVSVASNDFTKAHATRAVKLLFEYLPESYKNGTIRAREMVHHASTIAGIAFANSFLGITHSLSHQIGGAFHTPHGMTNAILMEHVIDYNAVDAPTRMGVYPQYTHPLAKQRYAELARAIGCNGNSDYELVQKFKQRISELKKSLDIPATFAEAGINKDAYYKIIDSLAEHAFDDQCTPANPRFPLVTELRHILESAYDGQPLSSRMYLEPKDAEANKAKA
uniref:Alcohol dehydrogenase 4 n=1 Tax=Hanusia phi TaxID=3032 RepID=A0A7S0E3L5_9CRYP